MRKPRTFKCRECENFHAYKDGVYVPSEFIGFLQHTLSWICVPCALLVIMKSLVAINKKIKPREIGIRR